MFLRKGLHLFVLIFLFSIPGVTRAQEINKAPLHGVHHKDILADRYIVVFKQGRRRAEMPAFSQLTTAQNGKIRAEFSGVINGFAAELPAAALEAIRRNPNVAYVEADRMVTIANSQGQLPSWGLDRIDQRGLPLSHSFTYGFDGSDVHAFVLDSGIRATHQEFAGRVGDGYDIIYGDDEPEDCNGHGTHVAGILGGTTYGVAKNATLHAVRVLSCAGNGSLADIIGGINWVAARPERPAVMNLSVSASNSVAVNQALQNAVDAGIVTIVAAGNNGNDACDYSPANSPAALTVGATDDSDSRADYSNIGSCVDIFAPGHGIYSAGIANDTAQAGYNGTSQAAPHVAGIAALHLQENPAATPTQIKDLILGEATVGVVKNAGTNSPNRLLYIPIPGLAVSQKTSQPVAVPGQLFTYTLEINNNSDLMATDVMLDDPFPGVVENLSFASDSPITAIGEASFSWDLGDMAANSSRLITITGLVTTTTAPGSTIVNTAIITTSTPIISNFATSEVIVNTPPQANDNAASAQLADGFETNKLDLLPWVSTGGANWKTAQNEVYAGNFSAQAGIISHNQFSSLKVTLETAAGSIQFARRVSSEYNSDWLEFYIDGVKLANWSGELPFSVVSFGVNAGIHTFEWRYVKDGSVSSWQDTAYIDDIVLPLPMSTSDTTPLTVSAPGLLQNDIDVDGQPLQISGYTPPTFGSVTIAADGSFVYTPALNYGGAATFTYWVGDGYVVSNSAAVTIAVASSNLPAFSLLSMHTGNDITLSWDEGNAGSYEVWSATAPFGTSTLIAPNLTGTNYTIPVTESGNQFYEVRSQSGGEYAAVSTRAGEFSFQILPGN